jgi:hypothetical protein
MMSGQMGGAGARRTLTKAELEHLKLWQKKMVSTFIVAMLVIVIGVPLKLAMGLNEELELFLGGLFVALAIVGGIIQFSEKCPNCGARIGMQSRLVLPARCVKCGISFREGIE